MRKGTIVLALLLAGCISPTDPQAPPEAASTEFLLGPDPGDPGAVEPTIAFAPDGTAFVAALMPGEGVLWRLDPGGAWTELDVSHGSEEFGQSGQDTDVRWIGDDLFFVELGAGPGITIGRSGDRGQTWTWTEPAGLLPPTDRPWVVGRDTILGLAYSSAAYGPVFARTLDSGNTYPVHTLVRPLDSRGSVALLGRPDVSPGGIIAIPYYTEDLAIGLVDYASTGGGVPLLDVGVALSSDGGTTWTHHLLPREDAWRAGIWSVQNALWIDEGTLALSFGEFSGTPRHARTFVTTLDVASGSFDLVEATGPGAAVMPWLAFHADRGLATVQYVYPEPVHPDDATGNWTVKAVFLETGMHAPITETPAKSGPLCGRGNACGGGEFLDFFTAAFTPEGRLAVTWPVEDSGAVSLRFAIEAT